MLNIWKLSTISILISELHKKFTWSWQNFKVITYLLKICKSYSINYKFPFFTEKNIYPNLNCCHILFNVFRNSLKCLCRVVPLVLYLLSVPCHFFVLSFWLEIESNINFVCIARMCFAAATNVDCAGDSCNEESIDAQSLSYDKSRHVVQGQTLPCKDKCSIN